ncbi:MAG: 1-(5-phosphoribosyl)-5-[(5-phosphoribosylamino)methylideneamino]imidazole-4-carboxamide isomerase [Verrucomicrobiota bacterium]
MILYPAIDIKHGACVRLTQGLANQETQYFDDPVEPGRVFLQEGADWVHVVDLDGAFSGQPTNLAIVKQIVALGLKVELGGGMRELETVDAALQAGVSRVVVGTRACQDREFVKALVAQWPEQVAVGIDAREGKVAVKGWVEMTDTPAIELAQQLAEVGVRTLIYTDISTDGMLTGPNFAGQREMLEAVPCRIIASGGVSQLEDITRYAALAKECPNLNGVIVGKALYEKQFTVAQALAAIA